MGAHTGSPEAALPLIFLPACYSWTPLLFPILEHPHLHQKLTPARCPHSFPVWPLLARFPEGLEGSCLACHLCDAGVMHALGSEQLLASGKLPRSSDAVTWQPSLRGVFLGAKLLTASWHACELDPKSRPPAGFRAFSQ